MIKEGDPQAVAVWEEYNKVAMNAFPLLSNSDIDNILAYTDYTPPAPVSTSVSTSACYLYVKNSNTNNDYSSCSDIGFYVASCNVILGSKDFKKRIAIASGVDNTCC